MRAAVAVVVTFAYDTAVTHYHRPYHRVGVSQSAAKAGKLEGPRHVAGVYIHRPSRLIRSTR